MPAGRILYILGLLLMILCMVDAALVRFGKIDLTGYPYTPIVLGGLGIVLINVARYFPAAARDPEEEE